MEFIQSWSKVDTKLCINFVPTMYQLCFNPVVYQLCINFYKKLMESWHKVDPELMQTLFQLSFVSTVYQLL